MKILVADEVVGTLTEEGEIQTDDWYLIRFWKRLKEQKLPLMRSFVSKEHGEFTACLWVQFGDKEWRFPVVEELLNAGYEISD